MSKARQQSSKRKSMRTLYGSQNGGMRSSKHPGMLMQVINIGFKKRVGRKSNRQLWLKTLPFHIGKTKFIYHKLN